MTTNEWGWLELAVVGGSHPVHAFHVLEIFPRIGLLRGGDTSGSLLDTMDACRIRWGRLVSADGDRLLVEAPRLELSGGSLRLGSPGLETVTGWRDEAGVLGGAVPGDHLALHWGWACDRLGEPQLAHLMAWTRTAISLANQAI
jgi:hypothetical protein